MSRYHLNAIVALVLLIAGPSVTVVADERPNRGKPDAAAKASPVPKTAAESLVSTFWSVSEIILANHIEPPTRQEMLQGAAKGIYRAADQAIPRDLTRKISGITSREQSTELFSDLLTQVNKRAKADTDLRTAMVEGLLDSIHEKPERRPVEFSKVAEQLAGNRYVGTGIQIKWNDKEQVTQILNPFRRGPAPRAGSKPGDLIVKVDGKETKGVPLEKIVQWLRGDKGTAVTVVVRQPGTTESRTLNMIRDVVPFDTVFGFRRNSEESWRYRIDPAMPIAYVWLANITSSTVHELRQVEQRLQSEGVRALIVDLRFLQDGGILHHAELVADAFLDGGVMWRVRDIEGNVRDFKADRECLFRDWPLVVLMNRQTTSKTVELVAAALQDNHRASIVGEPAKFDPYIKSVFELPENLGLILLRTARLERASSKVKDWGLQPDHLVTLTKTQEAAVLEWLQEKALPELPGGKDDRPPDDPQFSKAVDILRAALKLPIQTGHR